MQRPVRRFPLLLPIVATVVAFATQAALAADNPVDFNRDIRSILSNNCFKCHGPDSDERQAGLRLDTQAGATAETDSGGHAVVPGKPEASELIARITSDDADLRMPPVSAARQLKPAEVELLRDWIKQGAHFARHWSYEKPVRPPLPAVSDKSWPKNEVDYFLLARLEQEGLSPSPEADRYALIRRLSLDLTGLPPTWEEVQAFVDDKTPGTYERLVDRLLEKEAYGEHFARLWLDLARYADSAGYADDPPRTIWAYRDWVIRALNENKPFDQFTIEQIAGDLLENPTEDQLIATAFHRNTLTNNEGGTNDEEFRSVAIVDRVNTTMAVWMGTTIACAQCHNHKFDPITQEEYFRLYAIFNNSQDADRRDESPLVQVWTDEQEQQKETWRREIDRLERELKTETPELLAAQRKWEAQFAAELKWETLTPTSVVSQAGAKFKQLDDGSTLVVEAGKETDVYTFTAAMPRAQKLTALRLEALPDDSLPKQGPGFGDGNFVVSRVKATIAPPEGSPLKGRFVRVEIPGQNKILSLAEVQIFAAGENVAPQGEAKQSSTAFDGPSELAIDGNTDGDFNKKSTTHTASSKDPFWEVDLTSARAVDRIVVWNRTDGNVGTRLANFRVALLDENRKPVWETKVTEAPKTSVELSLDGVRKLEFAAARADYAQSGFDPATVLADDKDIAKNGWAVGGATGKPHELILTAKQPLEVTTGSRLTVTLEQRFAQGRQTLGRFRLAASDDPRAAQSIPATILAIVTIDAAKRTEQQAKELANYYLSIAPQLKASRDQLAKVKKQLADAKPYTTVPVMRELPDGRKTLIQHRGNFLDTGKEVTPGLPAAFHPLPEGAKVDRLALARWLVSDDNPLTARVIANRYWEKIFGIGLVRTSEEFGTQGELPTNPELLDWLATELMRLDWDMKAFLKLLVTSAAYRQSSRVTPELLAHDPDNTLLARGPRFRLPAETIRDQALAVSGLLSEKMYGPPVKPPQPSIGLSAAFGSGIDWQTSTGEDRYRRGLYTTWRRSNPYPSMAAFDAPNREVCTIRRDRTNTPLQALVTLNDPVYVEAAQALARRIASSDGKSIEDKARDGFEVCLSRPPSEKELAYLVALYNQAHERFAADAASAAKMATVPLGAAPEDADLVDLASWTVVGNVLLNLDEMFMRR